MRGVNLGLQEGEIFGLLGVNGAGKSSVFGILTGDLTASSGMCTINGNPITHPDSLSRMGYCPQADPLIELMNSYETLYFYGGIRGVPRDILEQRVQKLVDEVGLSKHAKRPCGTYSGGNKRKLSLAIALIGEPQIVFLDEPSSGMDPYARRKMWDVIAKVSKNRTVVLTTHSMEECEALCSRITIMGAGRMKCLGSCQHLKSRFGAGYQIEMNFLEGLHEGAVQTRVDLFIEAMGACSSHLITTSEPSVNCIPNADDTPQEGEVTTEKRSELLSPPPFTLSTSRAQITIEEIKPGYARLNGGQALDVGLCFRYLETNKQALDLADYSVSQYPLEQIFNDFQEAEAKKLSNQ